MVKQSSGWALFDIGSEYNRMGVPNSHWIVTDLNERYEVCKWFVSVYCMLQLLNNRQVK